MTDEFSDIPVFMEQMAESIKKTAVMLNNVETSAFFDLMLKAKRVYVAGPVAPG